VAISVHQALELFILLLGVSYGAKGSVLPQNLSYTVSIRSAIYIYKFKVSFHLLV
jgi:hypothetical protein